MRRWSQRQELSAGSGPGPSSGRVTEAEASEVQEEEAVLSAEQLEACLADIAEAKGQRGKGQVWETHSQTIRSDNWRDFRKKCLFQCGGPAGIRTQISGFTDRCSTVELQNQRLSRVSVLSCGVLSGGPRGRGHRSRGAAQRKGS
jgi:hypothetical protein